MVYFNMIYSYKKLFLLALFPFLTILSGQECDPGFVWLDDPPVSCGGEQNCFYIEDLNVLQSMIDNSFETINMSLDDNEDGVMEPVELGYSEWVNGRLVELDCYLSDVMDCNLLPGGLTNISKPASKGSSDSTNSNFAVPPLKSFV